MGACLKTTEESCKAYRYLSFRHPVSGDVITESGLPLFFLDVSPSQDVVASLQIWLDHLQLAYNEFYDHHGYKPLFVNGPVKVRSPQVSVIHTRMTESNACLETPADIIV